MGGRGGSAVTDELNLCYGYFLSERLQGQHYLAQPAYPTSTYKLSNLNLLPSVNGPHMIGNQAGSKT